MFICTIYLLILITPNVLPEMYSLSELVGGK
jgi:hypothetical protein